MNPSRRDQDHSGSTEAPNPNHVSPSLRTLPNSYQDIQERCSHGHAFYQPFGFSSASIKAINPARRHERASMMECLDTIRQLAYSAAVRPR